MYNFLTKSSKKNLVLCKVCPNLPKIVLVVLQSELFLYIYGHFIAWRGNNALYMSLWWLLRGYFASRAIVPHVAPGCSVITFKKA